MELPSGANNTKENLMTEESGTTEHAEWPKGLYMIFLTTDTDGLMGKVIGLTSATAIIHPWDVLFGGVDEDIARQVVLADCKTFISFDDIWDMEKYFEDHHWNLMTGEDIKMGDMR